MFALPALSGRELVEVLGRFGYKLASRKGGLATLHRGHNVVVVPEAANLSPTLIRAILRTAEVDPLDFVRDVDATLLAAPGHPRRVA